ncbi:MAG TPA: HAD-IC family P-type ATPase [Candidatus Limnocylindrales bacterium]
MADRVARGLTNDAGARVSRSVWEIVRSNVFTRINAIFAVLFAIIVSTGYFLDGLFGFLIIANSVVGVVQELRAKRTLDRLSIIGQARPRVRRDGDVKELAPREVVADDLIELAPGDQAVVDGEVIDGEALEVDESLLTGESEPVVKRPGDRMLSGSFVIAGSGLYRATAVGPESYAAKLAAQASKFTLVNSELRNGINRILKVITYLLVPVGALSIYNQLSGDQALPDALRGMVAALVPMVPEGLVLMTSIAFAVGVVRLGRRQCLVNELPAIEGLARVDVVCADKTGTLTENAMRLSSVKALGGGGEDVDATLAALAAADPHPNPSMRAIAEAYPDPPGWTVEEVAAFSSARKWSGVRFGGGKGTWLLGAPDVLLPDGDPTREQAEGLAAQGLRVLLLASAPHLPRPGEGVSARALVVLEQRIRPDAKETLEYFAAQGVTVKVMSGDNPASVGAVAASLDLPGAGDPVDARDGDAVEAKLESASVFGRVTPEQKRIMVGALQGAGHTVAMTGDGVNDVLALKDADIGVAMGSGSPATRAVAQIVLLDNKFATLPYVVAEGRRVIGNIARVSTLFLTKTIYSVMLALVVGIPGLIGFEPIPYPFLPRHVTVMGWFTIGLPAFVLSLAPNAERARPGFVPRVMRLAIPAGVAIGLACFVSYVIADAHGDRVQASTAGFITTVTIALWVLAVIARPYTWWKVALVAVMALLSALMLIWPPTQRLLELDPGNPTDLAIAFACAAGGIAVTHLIWRFTRR